MEITREVGEVKFLSALNNDEFISNAAGISTGISNKGSEHVKRRINFLVKNGHSSPFEHGVISFEVKCPLFTARQWLRHRMSSTTEKSGRYTIMKEFYIPKELNPNDFLVFLDRIQTAYETYKNFIDNGMPYEKARMILPVNIMTRFVWTVNLRSLMNFLEQRLDEHAQYEIRVLAKEVEECFENSFPVSYQAWKNQF